LWAQAYADRGTSQEPHGVCAFNQKHIAMNKKEREAILQAFEKLDSKKRDLAIHFVIGWLKDSVGNNDFWKALKKYTGR